MYHITSLNYQIKGEGVTNLNLSDDVTLLDSDIVIINPRGISEELEKGLATNSVKSLSPYWFNRFQDRLKLFSKEIDVLLESGKLIFCFLTPLKEYRLANRTRYDGDIHNYHFLPYDVGYQIRYNICDGKSTAEGTLKLGKRKTPFDGLFKALKKDFSYVAYLDWEDDKNQGFIFNKASKPVGAVIEHNKGAVVFLPLVGTEFEKKFVSSICQVAQNYYKREVATEAPEWVKDFDLPGEEQLEERRLEVRKRIEDLAEKEKEIQKEIQEISSYKELLYEQGSRLEVIVRKSFELLGFKVSNRDTGKVEHDILFSSDEGKGIAEVEGKDNTWINVGKTDQLSRAVDEDFEITNSYARGVLIGNHFRLQNPDERKEAFTDTARTVAERKRFALLNTVDLFRAVKYILNNPDDLTFKVSARKAILETEGEEVKFEKVLENKV